MVKCVVKVCKKDTRKHTKLKSNITFHRFPKSPDLMKKWVDAIRRPDWEPNIWSKVCSTHFSDTSMYETKSGLRKLVQDAVPTLFLRQSPSPDHQSELTSSSNPLQSVSGRMSVVNSEIPDTPRKRKLKKEIIRLEDIAKRRRLRCKTLYAARTRLKKKVDSLSLMLKELNDKRFITQEHHDILEVCEVSVKDLYKRMLNKEKRYTPALRSFALTLHFYSPKAYSYLRSTFNTCLPHPSTIRKWYKSIDAAPGFTTEAFKVLRLKAKESEKKIICNLVTDEMSIRLLNECNEDMVQGFVDFGGELNEPGDLSLPCTQALVFLLVAMNESWKLPVGYFLVNGVTGEQRANLVKMCLTHCHDAGVEVVSMTFDGCPANIAMAKQLGCSFDYQGNLQTSFPHPETSKPVSVFLDPCHMIKLVRNTLENKKILQDENGGKIKWQYFIDLNTLQQNEMFHLANKLTSRHIAFSNQKMKVKLAVQLLSRSVAKAIEYCDKELHILNFFNSDATVFFTYLINDLFDLLNSRKFPGIDYKAPINEKNEAKYLAFMEKTQAYLKKLVVFGDKQPLMCTRNRIGFLGLYVCINSMKELYQRLVKVEKVMTFIPMYKISQDHLEILFSVIRSHGGFNNNPSALQFKAIYRKLLVHMELKESFRGNCVPLEHITLLTCSSSADHINLTTKGYRSKLENVMVDEQFMADLEEEDSSLPKVLLSELSQHIVSYIAGYVVRYLFKKIHCPQCFMALVSNKPANHHAFIAFKDRGGLVYPSEDVFAICNATETIVKTALCCLDGNYDKKEADLNTKSMVIKTLKLFIGKDIFSVLHSHLFEQEPCSNHLVHLLSAVIQKYVDIRVKYLVRRSNVKETKRQVYNKLTHFKGQ